MNHHYNYHNDHPQNYVTQNFDSSSNMICANNRYNCLDLDLRHSQQYNRGYCHHVDSTSSVAKRLPPQPPRRSPSTRLSSSSESSQLSADHAPDVDIDLSYPTRRVSHDDTPESGYHTSEYGGSEQEYPLEHSNTSVNRHTARNSIPYNSVERTFTKHSNIGQDQFDGNGGAYEYTICPPPPCDLICPPPPSDLLDEVYDANEDYQTHIPTHQDLSESGDIYGQFRISSHNAPDYNQELYSTTIVKNNNIFGVLPHQTIIPSPPIQAVPPPPPMSPDMFPPPPLPLNIDVNVPATLPKPKPTMASNSTNYAFTNSISSNSICANMKQSRAADMLPTNETMQKIPYVAPKPKKSQSANSSPSHVPTPLSYDQTNNSFNDDLSSAESQFKAATQRLSGQLHGMKLPNSNSNTSLTSSSSHNNYNQESTTIPEEGKQDLVNQIQVGVALRPSPKGEQLRVGTDFKAKSTEDNFSNLGCPPPPPVVGYSSPDISLPPLVSAPPTLPKPTRSEIPIMPTNGNNSSSPNNSSSSGPVDVRNLPGFQEVPDNAPEWKKAMIKKRNKELEEEFKSELGQKQKEEERWRGVPEWKKKIMMEKENKKKEEDAIRSEHEKKAMMLDEKHADLPAWKKDIIKKKRGDMS